MNTKKLMTKVTLGAAMILTTAAVATTAVVPAVVRADDTAVVDKDAKVFTVYGFNGHILKGSYNEVYDTGDKLEGIAKLRDFEYTLIDPETGYWAVGPNGEQNYDPNSVTTKPTTPSTTEPTTPSTTKPTTPTQTKAEDNTKVLPKAGDSSILSMLAGSGILSGFGLAGLKRKFKK